MSTIENEIGPDGKPRMPRQNADVLLTIVVDQKNFNYGFNIRGLNDLRFIHPYTAAARWPDDVISPLAAAWYALLSALRSLSDTNFRKLQDRANDRELRMVVNSTNQHFINSLVLFDSGVNISEVLPSGIKPYLPERVADYVDELNISLLGQHVAADFFEVKSTFSWVARMLRGLEKKDPKSPHELPDCFMKWNAKGATNESSAKEKRD